MSSHPGSLLSFRIFRNLPGFAATIFIMALALSSPLIAQGPPAECQAGLGGTVFGAGREVEVEILPGNESAIYVSDLYMIKSGKNIHFGNSRQPGRIVRLGRMPAGEELSFYIIVRQTGNVFFSGDPSRNPDGAVHAVVECDGAGGAILGFEDLIESESDHSYNDLRFHVRFSPLCGTPDQNRATVDPILSFGSCPPAGPKSPQWGRFGPQAVLESDAGEKLEVACSGNQFVLYYTPPDGGRKSVGLCPFEGGCNSAYFKHSGDANGNGKPDCFLQTVWRSADYAANDNPSDGVLNHALFTFDVKSGNRLHQDLKYAYRIPPPVNCQSPDRAEGRLLGKTTVEFGPAPGGFANRMAAPLLLAETSEPMQADPFSVADLNRDGQLDDADRTLFNNALGSCEGDDNYDSFADLDPDGCVTFADQAAFLDLLNGDQENLPPVAICKDVVVAAGAACQATVVAADVNDHSFDPDSDEITFTLAPPGPLGLGEHLLTLTVTDGGDASSSCQATATVADQTVPVVQGTSVDKPVLWPPNHKMVEVEVRYGTTDGCGVATASLSVSSNEPADGGGDGDTSPDWEVVDAHHVRLRAERSGGGTGRIYTITITAADSSGNLSTRDLQVIVPHNR